ncbi:MAG: hypothetical protein ACU85E_09285 [Gammaproteobacteria bacterium]
MSDPFEKQPIPFPLPGIISILVALLAIFAEQFEPLQSSRPLTPKAVKQQESINARLWQDPFAVVEDYLNTQSIAKKQGGYELDDIVRNIVMHLPDSETEPVIVLGVMVFGGAYAELTEFRLRTRYAVLSGLAAADYVPEDAEHIKYIDTSSENALPDSIPFEWFVDKQRRRNRAPILLLWLNESDFMNRPLRALQNLIDQLTDSIKATQSHASGPARLPSRQRPIQFKFIGPTSSNLLIKMIAERMSSDFDESLIKEPLELYIASATADEKILLQNAAPLRSAQSKALGLEKICHESLSTCFKSLENDNSLIHFIRIIAEDGELIETLLDELKLRGVDPIDEHGQHPLSEHFTSKSHIALISEWDTFYGRSLPDAMINRINARSSENNSSELSICVGKTDNPKQPSWLHLYSYMRGLDGIVPGAMSNENNTTKQTQTGADNSIALTERPEGQSRQDYLRRLAARIEATNECLDRNNEGEIRAFGILGSDVYDKLMVLRALRPKFPRALFFTTDLDARLLHPDEYGATRNLIVASSFGFQLHPNLQDKIPPFRDGYSTAYFLATQIARYNAASSEKLTQLAIDNMRKPPRIFELGFQEAIDFAAPNALPCPNLVQCENIHPAGYTVWPGKKKIIALPLAFGLAVLILALLCQNGGGWFKRCLSLSHNPNQETSSDRCKKFAHPILLPAFGTLTLGLIVLIMESHPGYQGEPFSWVGGISLWPSILIRLLACILCWLFVFKVMRDLPAIQTRLARRFLLPDLKPTTIQLAGLEQWLKPWQVELKHDASDMQSLWHSYRVTTQPDFLRYRALLTSLIYLALGVCLVIAFGTPLVPYRGPVSLAAHWLVLIPTIIGFVYLIMLIADATRHCIKLIHIVGDQRLSWPKKTLKRFGFEGAQPFLNQAIPVDTSDEESELRRVPDEHYQLERWLGIQFITALTKGLGNLVYYPFIILALLVFALTPVFDNWRIPQGLALVFIFSALLTLACGLLLRRAAEHCRNAALKSLTITLMAVRGRDEISARMMENQLTLAIDQIKSIREGAFLPLTHEPAIQALLLPLGGWGGFTILEHIILRGA